ncbi:hypothetical protein ES695_00350 [Candidatus Atribacteria bacterium 1244-E10-H5-B2]|nr:MAG: hypothetical protein ES695_00350 [Candidatus Atribacteria bacterium 1244-E10-H5-B2]
MNIKVKCKSCDWEGQATVGKRGFPLDAYGCPRCGQRIGRCRGRYDLLSEMAKLRDLKKAFRKGIRVFPFKG